MMISTSIPIRKKKKMAVIWAWEISRPHHPGRDARSGEALAIRKALLQDAEAKTEFGGWTAGGWNCTRILHKSTWTIYIYYIYI